jgi:preprotein translocase subunit SecY
MPFCTNPDCPHRKETGGFAEYRDGITICPECGSPLSDNTVDFPDKNEKIESDLFRKILITIGLLLIYRLMCIIPLPGVDISGLPDNLLMRYFNSDRISIGALGIMPYISAYFFVEILSLVIPPLNRWRREKHEGRRKLTVTARWLTLILCLIQGFGIAISLSRMTGPGGSPVLAGTGLGFRFIIVITLTACVFINLWIADLISSRGIGNGISMIIFTGIIFFMFSALAASFQNTVSDMNLTDGTVKFIFILLILSGSGALSLFMERGKYNLEVKLQNNSNVVMPFKYNISGIIPAVLAASYVILPASVMNFTRDYPNFFKYFQYGTWTYFITFTIFTTVLYFWFTALYYNPDKILNFLRSKNAEPVLPNGVSFEKLLDKKLTTLTIWGALYLFVYSVLLSPGITALIVISGLAVIRVVSISLDIINDVNARKKHGYFVKIDEFQKPYEAGFIKNLLEQNSIPCFLEGYYHRSLYYFFGPFIEISLYVQRDKESEALNIIFGQQMVSATEIGQSVENSG